MIAEEKWNQISPYTYQKRKYVVTNKKWVIQYRTGQHVGGYALGRHFGWMPTSTTLIDVAPYKRVQLWGSLGVTSHTSHWVIGHQCPNEMDNPRCQPAPIPPLSTFMPKRHCW